MTIEQLRHAYQERPFKPFTICLADGRRIPVPSPGFLYLRPDAARTFVVSETPDVYKIIDLLLVTSLDFGNGRPQRRMAR